MPVASKDVEQLHYSLLIVMLLVLRLTLVNLMMMELKTSMRLTVHSSLFFSSAFFFLLLKSVDALKGHSPQMPKAQSCGNNCTINLIQHNRLSIHSLSLCRSIYTSNFTKDKNTWRTNGIVTKNWKLNWYWRDFEPVLLTFGPLRFFWIRKSVCDLIVTQSLITGSLTTSDGTAHR